MNLDDTELNVVSLVENSLDQDLSRSDLAKIAGYSVAQHRRKIRQVNPDPPMTIRRRLLLERAAYGLTRLDESVTEIAFDAGFESLEGFSRCFKRHFGVSPRQYRQLKPSDYRLDVSERTHFAPAHLQAEFHRRGVKQMKPYQLLIEHHCTSMESILERCKELSPEQLRQDLSTPKPFPWLEGNETILGLLNALAGFANPWLATLTGTHPRYDGESIEGLKEGLAENKRLWIELVAKIDEENRWDLTFVDSLCDPPEVFSFVGVVGHVITFNAYRRVLLINQLKKLGFDGLGFGDPLEYRPFAESEP